MLSSKPGSGDRLAALKAGAHGYLEKTCQLEECLFHAQSLMGLYTKIIPGRKEYLITQRLKFNSAKKVS